jgi:hypothetical protein
MLRLERKKALFLTVCAVLRYNSVKKQLHTSLIRLVNYAFALVLVNTHTK